MTNKLPEPLPNETLNYTRELSLARKINDNTLKINEIISYLEDKEKDIPSEPEEKKCIFEPRAKCFDCANSTPPKDKLEVLREKIQHRVKKLYTTNDGRFYASVCDDILKMIDDLLPHTKADE